jgi:hypothetical protein
MVKEEALVAAETPVEAVCNVVLALTAVAIFEATCAEETYVLPDQYANVGGLDVPEVVPLIPAARVVAVQVKLLRVSPSVMALPPVEPSVLELTVTTAPLEIAPTPTAG